MKKARQAKLRRGRQQRYGLLAGIAGAALCTWWFRRRGTVAQQMAAGSPQGETIYSNAPTAP